MTRIAEPLLTAAEYARLEPSGRRTELVRGRVVEMTPPYPYHGFVCINAGSILRDFARANRLGRVMGNDAGVPTERDPDTVRGADVCFYSYTRLPAGPMPKDSYFDVPPELVVEVRSPSDRWSKVLAKVTEYLAAGVTAVCVLDPMAETALVYRDAQNPETFRADDELTLPDVLPGFRVQVRQFFE